MPSFVRLDQAVVSLHLAESVRNDNQNGDWKTLFVGGDRSTPLPVSLLCDFCGSGDDDGAGDAGYDVTLVAATAAAAAAAIDGELGDNDRHPDHQVAFVLRHSMSSA